MQRNDFGKTSDSTAPRAMVSENAVIAAKDAEIARLTAALEHQRHETGKRQSQADRWRHERDTESINRQQAEAERDAALAAIDRAKAEGMRMAADIVAGIPSWTIEKFPFGRGEATLTEPTDPLSCAVAIIARAKDMEAEPRAAAQEKGGAA